MVKTERHDTRFYYQPTTRAAMRGSAIVIFLLWMGLVGGPGISVIGRVLLAVAAFAILFCFWYLGGRGLEACPGGIRFRRWFRWTFIPWREIGGFRFRGIALFPTVLVDLTSGDSRIVPLSQGLPTRWNGGKSRDPVAALNTELAKQTQLVQSHNL